MRQSNRNRSAVGALTLLLAAAVLIAVPAASLAVPDAMGVVIDDFEDNDTSDWGFFGGNNAGGGGGPFSDRPYEGSFYFSTGWGGEGTASDFYGGAFKNFAEADQVTPPADPWLNVWVLNQSDATADGHRLEITIREDLDGNGWTNGSEDSFRLDTSFTSGDYDDEWHLISAPVGSLTDLFTGGDGTFNGNLDEVVIVIAGVQGGNPSTVELDFDLFSFSSGGPLAFDEVVFDDMEHGDPFANGWFSFTGGGGGGINANSVDLPPANGGAFSLETGWGSGGVPGFYGGFGRTNLIDVSGTDHFNMWVNPDGGQDYTLEINLQEDDNGDDAINPPDDDEFQFNCVVSATGPCAIAGGGWQLVSIPLDDFFDDNSFLTGGNGVLDPTTAARGGNGQLINVVIAIIGTDVGGSSSDVNFRTDYWAFTSGPLVPDTRRPIDDFESGVAPGTPCAPGAPPLNFCTFNGAGSSVAVSNPATPPAPVLPVVGTPNSVLQMDVDVTSFAGLIRGFETGGEWATQDWSTSEGFSLWMHGTASGTTVFIDILDNRNPGSTTDDAERWSVDFVDDFVGWQLLEFPFSSFSRKEVGNGAPNDGFGRFQVHGWALGTLGTGGPLTYYVDEVSLYGVSAPPDLAVSFALTDNPIEEGTTGDVTVKLNRPFGAGDPAQVSVDYSTDIAGALAGEEYIPTSGTLVFTNGGPTELAFSIETFDDTKFEGEERIVLRLSNAVDVELGSTQARAVIVDNDPYDPLLIDDFEQGAFLWDGAGPIDFDAGRVAVGGPDERPGQDSVENVLEVEVLSMRTRLQDARDDVADLLPAGNAGDDRLLNKAVKRLNRALDPSRWADDNQITKSGVIDRMRRAVNVLLQVDSIDTEPLALTLAGIAHDIAEFALNDAERNGGDAALIALGRRLLAQGDNQIFNNGKIGFGMKKYIRAWRKAIRAMEEPGLAPLDLATDGFGSAAMSRDFPIGQDWTGTESLEFWFNGTGSGEEVTVNLMDNRAPDPGPAGWTMVWSDEFNDPAGTAPNPANWSYELGDGALNGIEGWGNSELQYYTDDTDNAATDGAGNLVMTLREADGAEQCFYGPCEYTSSRIISSNKAEFAYGRIESRLLVPDGGDGLWPAFWSLGADINRTPWPAAGEIDFMEYVSRLPNEIFGTIHGPGYSGGNAFGNIWDFGEPVYNDYHTFTVEWEPNLITWYVDGIEYHQATPADVPGPWVFNKPFYLLLNFAIGGNFGGTPDPANSYPQEYLIDYVRVYQGPDTAERFEASFTDNVAGWQLVTVPIANFSRSADQPIGAPDDGLGLGEVWGYGFELATSAPGTYLIDQVHRVQIPPPTELVVTTLADSGDGSLREALGVIADGGTITFDAALAGGTIGLTSGQLVVDRSVTIDAAAAPGVVVSGSGASRVFQVDSTATVSMNDLEVADGVGAPQGGGILNFGTLSLDRVVVRDNTQSAAGPANFEFGGGGVYNGAGATLNLTDSTVQDNDSPNQPGGGVYGFFGSTINITRSTISGNSSGDVAGGLRSLGNATVLNSTFSGNVSTVWHGGGIFHTDGELTVTNSTFAENVAPAGTASGILVATFGAPANATLTNNVLEGFGDAFACAIEGGGAATITSGGSNVISDGSCNPNGSTDQSATDALLGPLADNGGPTLTHALGAGSPAIDTANDAFCPATDQRGVARPQGGGCDVGAFEVQ